MARKSKPYLTTGEVAKICDVTKVTAANWIRSGKLKAYRPPKGWYRVHPKDLFDFLAAGGMPIPEGLEVDGAGGRTHVLVVDDEPSFGKFVTQALEARSDRYHVTAASNGFEAGRRIGERKPDAILLDLHMPGIDGFEVCRSLKSSGKYSDIVVIVVSGFLDDEARQRAEAAGADLCLPKPAGAEQLVGALESALGDAAPK
jgi:excisionase family DNA binding protein